MATEGDELYYEVRGQGQPLLMIAGANGDADTYAAVADILSTEYKVITYDRRANARSTMNFPQNFEISQQSRDAVAVLHAAGETSAFVFGNSSGAVIALDIAKTHPQAVRAIIAHEPPLARIHPKARKWQRFFASVYWTAFRFGTAVAGLRFIFGLQVPILALVKGHNQAAAYAKSHREHNDEPRISQNDTSDNLIKLELLPVTNYLPGIETIKNNGVKVFLAVGEWGRKRETWLAQTSRIMAEKLDCELVTFPGHHSSHTDRPDEWAATLRSILHKVEETNVVH